MTVEELFRRLLQMQVRTLVSALAGLALVAIALFVIVRLATGGASESVQCRAYLDAGEELAQALGLPFDRDAEKANASACGGDDAVQRPLTDFIEDARAGRVAEVDVHTDDLRYRLVGDTQTFKATMEEGDTVRQLLQDAGVQPEDFPPIEIKD